MSTILARNSNQWTRTPLDALCALRDHIWTAYDIARNTRWKYAPTLVDLLAGRRRKGFCESPDSLYTIGFINIQRGSVCKIKIPKSSALYVAVSLSGGGQQAVLELTRNSDNDFMSSRDITLADGVSSNDALDTSVFSGLTQLMIRQYFNNAHVSLSASFPQVEYTKLIDYNRLQFRIIPAGVLSGCYFLTWRLKSVLGIKLLQYRLGSQFPRNHFMTVEEIRGLWRGGHLTVNRLGINSFRYYFCIFDLKPGKVLKLSYKPNRSLYFAFSLNNSWMQGIDAHYRGTYMNSIQLHKGLDGSYTVYVGNQNRGYNNFLDTKGYRKGLIHFREILPADGSQIPHAEIIQDGEDNV